ncbi:hypothetical protein [Rhizobium aethiopicum]|uniref:Uncharacterized protein n=1 Tax=Rhizobium aethiopicum TaxID=1138170 RepID=A0A7W6QA62_9HYPH|nr:hypothetical protein [Rhizobium aethiopicum]MBB4192830.1 hypothetical protein [Rhizobium aethiopicum]
MDNLLTRSWRHGFGHVGDAVTPTPKYIETVKRRVWEIHIRDHDKHIRREDLNAVLGGVDFVLDYYSNKVAELEAVIAAERTTNQIECSRYAYERDVARRERDDLIAQQSSPTPTSITGETLAS